MADAKKPKALPRFEGRQVAASRITVPGMGGGLNDALDVQPIALKHGQEGWGIFRWAVRDVDHVPLKKRGGTQILARHHVLVASDVMIVESDEQADALEHMMTEHANEVRRAKDSMVGQTELPDPSVPDDELSEEELSIRRALQGKSS